MQQTFGARASPTTVIAVRVSPTLALAATGIAVIALHVRPDAPAPTVADTIEIHGNRLTRDKVILRELGLATPMVIDADTLGMARRHLLALGYFLAVDISTRPSATAGFATIDVEVVERPTRFVVNPAFTSVESFVAGVTMTQIPGAATRSEARGTPVVSR